jgi:putative endonuclease
MTEPTEAPRGGRTRAQRLGDAAESIVAAHREATGWRLLARDLRLGRQELDLLAIDPGPPDELVVVEVRWRGGRDYGLPEETIGRAKQARLREIVGRLLGLGELPDGTALPRLPVRVDIVAVEPATSGGGPRIRHHRNALGG